MEEAVFICSRAESAIVRRNILVIKLADVRIDRGRLAAGVVIADRDHKIRLPALDQIGDILLGLPVGPIVADDQRSAPAGMWSPWALEGGSVAGGRRWDCSGRHCGWIGRTGGR